MQFDFLHTVWESTQLCKRRAKRSRSHENVLPQREHEWPSGHLIGHPAINTDTKSHKGARQMLYLRITGAALLTGVGLGSLAASSVLWKQAGIDLTPILSRVLNIRA